MLARFLLVCLAITAPLPLAAQDHSSHAGHAGEGPAADSTPREAGQSAFAAIAEVVQILDADPGTDWSRVDLEALRRHLVTMDRVLLESWVDQRAIPGGVAFDVTGPGEVERAIREMLPMHARALVTELDADVTPTVIPGGIRMAVALRTSGDSGAIARVRGLGFAGLLVLGSHHAAHHLALARGDGPAAHRSPE